MYKNWEFALLKGFFTFALPFFIPSFSLFILSFFHFVCVHVHVCACVCVCRQFTVFTLFVLFVSVPHRTVSVTYALALTPHSFSTNTETLQINLKF